MANQLDLSVSLAGAEAECRSVQHFQGATAAAIWWERNFAHIYPFYRYDVIEQGLVRRD